MRAVEITRPLASLLTPVDWDGVSHDERYNLSHYLLANAGTYTSRDEMFNAIGETLNPLVLAMLNPVLSHIRA